ncbi:MAG TPA: polymer-forming cytoskeletal protein [Candidatus Saccharimonadales bacterium]
MRKLKLILAAALILAVPLFAFAGTVYAGNVRSGDNVTVKKGEVIDHTLFIAGNNVEVNGEIKGDLFCAGQNVNVNAKVSGDVLCAGMNVRVEGTVEGDVRLAGQNITLLAKVARNASLAGNTITAEADSMVGGDLQAFGSMTTLSGQVVRDIDTAGENVTVNGMVGRNVSAAGENFTLGGAANIAGNVIYQSNNTLHQADGAQVIGEISREKLSPTGQNETADTFASSFMFFLMLLILSMALVALFPRLFTAISGNAFEKPGVTALVGLATNLFMPMLIIGSFVTVVGVLLGIVLLLAWMVIMMLSCTFFGFYLGRLALSRTNQHPLLIMFVGVLIVTILTLIPIVNVITYIAAVLFGTGMVMRELLRRTPKPVYETGVTHLKKK